MNKLEQRAHLRFGCLWLLNIALGILTLLLRKQPHPATWTASGETPHRCRLIPGILTAHYTVLAFGWLWRLLEALLSAEGKDILPLRSLTSLLPSLRAPVRRRRKLRATFTARATQGKTPAAVSWLVTA